jgi:hypothetical protein
LFVVAKHITVVLGCDPKIEAASKGANASAKSMKKRGRSGTPPNHPHHPTPPNTSQEKKERAY